VVRFRALDSAVMKAMIDRDASAEEVRAQISEMESTSRTKNREWAIVTSSMNGGPRRFR